VQKTSKFGRIFWNADYFIKSPNNFLNLKYRKPPRQETRIQKDARNAHRIVLKKPLKLDQLKDRRGGNKPIGSFTDGIT